MAPKLLCLVFVHSALVLFTVNLIACWEHFRRAEEYIYPPNTQNIDHNLGNITFGMCNNQTHQKSFHLTEPVTRTKGNIMLRGWLNVRKTPNCVMLSPESYDKAIEYNIPLFQITLCIARVTYCHSRKRFHYYYYEWFYPTEWTPTGWNLSFYFYDDKEFPEEKEKAKKKKNKG